MRVDLVDGEERDDITAVGADVDHFIGADDSEGNFAGGDHLHFTMLLAGHAVTPIDWWSQQWVDDRILRKLRQAAPGQPAPAGVPTTGW